VHEDGCLDEDELAVREEEDVQRTVIARASRENGKKRGIRKRVSTIMIDLHSTPPKRAIQLLVISIFDFLTMVVEGNYKRQRKRKRGKGGKKERKEGEKERKEKRGERERRRTK
jgi:hypothetical protein